MDDPPVIAGLTLSNVLAPLGRGGFATVWAGERDGAPVAVKIAHRATAAARERAAREAAALRRLDGLHAPRLVASGDVDGRPYLVMTRIAPAPPSRAIESPGSAGARSNAKRCGEPIVRALAAIHARGVVHGDIKPSNLAGDAFLDFGSAAIDGQPAMPGASVAYTAPELWRGEPVSQAADVYAIGAVLYALAVGHPPFVGEPRAARHAHLMLRPSFAGVDGELAAILRGCLAKDPAARPTSAALADAIAAWRPSAPIEVVVRRETRTFAIAVADARAPAPLVARAIAERGGTLLRVRGERFVAAWPGRDVAGAVASARELHARHGARAFVDLARIACDDAGEPIAADIDVPARWSGVIGTARVAEALRLRANAFVDLLAADACDDAPLVGRDGELARAQATTALAIRGEAGVGRSRFARELAARWGATLVSARDGDELPAGPVVVDDADAASDALLAALEHHPRFAAVGSSRRVEQVARDIVELLPLPDAAARELFESALGVERIADDVMTRLVALAGGKPGAILDLAAHLERSGAIASRGGRRYLAADAVTLPADHPEAFLAEAALAALPDELRALASAMAWLEPGFDLAELEAAAGACDGIADPALGVVELAKRGVGTASGLATAALVGAARRLLADPAPLAAAALVVVERGDDARSRRAIAHYAAVTGDRPRAAAQLLALADDARRAHRDADAESDYTAALRDLADRAPALLGRGIVRYRLDRAADALADLDEAAALGDARARLEAATALDWLSRYAESAAAVELAAEAPLDTPELACALAMARGRSALRAGRSDLAIPHLEAAADSPPRVDCDDHRMVALLLLGPALVHTGDLAGAERRFDDALGLADRLGDALARCAALGNRQLLWSARGDHARARADLHAARELARRLGHAVPERNTTYNLAEYLYWSGELAEAARLAQVSRDLQHRLVGRAVEDDVLIARIAATRGDDAAARAALADTHGAPPMIATLARAVAAVLDRDLAAFADLEADLLGEELVEVLGFRYATELAAGRVEAAAATRLQTAACSQLQAWRFRGSGLQAGAPS